MNSLKQLPWPSLCVATILAVGTMKVIDFVIDKSVAFSSTAPAFLHLLFTPPGMILLLLCEGLALGAFGVLYLERWGRTGPIYASVLWALAFCLWMGLWLTSHLPISGMGLRSISNFQVLSMIVGVFWRGRLYWR